mgnify:CR=1 FL=1|jgi:protein-tyrosine-phosphatase
MQAGRGATACARVRAGRGSGRSACRQRAGTPPGPRPSLRTTGYDEVNFPQDLGGRRKSVLAMDEGFSVLFLCTHNSARSVAAECVTRTWWANRESRGGQRMSFYSAGTRGSGDIKIGVLRALERAGYSMDGLRGKSLESLLSSGEVVQPITHIVTMCCDAEGDVKEEPRIRELLLSSCGRAKWMTYTVPAPTTQCRKEGLCGHEAEANVHYDRCCRPRPWRGAVVQPRAHDEGCCAQVGVADGGNGIISTRPTAFRRPAVMAATRAASYA